MGLVFRGMLGVTVSQILSANKSLYCYCQNGGKTTKTLGVLMDKQNHPTFPYRSFSPQMGPKKKILARIC